MKKKRIAWLLTAPALVLGLLIGCGTNKNLEPQSDLNYNGADPPAMNVGVDPPQTRQAYFLFTVQISDPELSMISKDAWTIDSYDLSYTLTSDPGHHILAAPESIHKKFHVVVQPNSVTRLPVVLVTDTYLKDNALGLVGTSDTATLKVHMVFRTHRNKDGQPKTLVTRYYLTLGNF